MRQTPMLKQYLNIKSQYPDTILFFRLGDFYEMFYDDAVTAAPILEIALTSRNKGAAESVPLCGVPHHAAQGYIAKLLSSGKRVAICDQIEDPKTAKGVVKREVVRVITPGTTLEEESLEAGRPSFVAAVTSSKNRFGFSCLDLSTGRFVAGEVGSQATLIDTLSKLEPKEILFPRSWEGGPYSDGLKKHFSKLLLSPMDEPQFDPQAVASLQGAETLASQAPASLAAAGCLWHYASYTQKGTPAHIHRIDLHTTQHYLILDESAQKHLELIRTQDGDRRGSLLHLLDQTSTAIGARLLREWLLYPLLSIAEIQDRQSGIQTLLDQPDLQTLFQKTLPHVSDLERLMGRVALGHAHGRDVAALKNSLNVFPKLMAVLPDIFASLRQSLDGFETLAQKIGQTLVDDPPFTLQEGGLIRPGVHAELDALRDIQKNGKGTIATLEEKERAATGIGSLKVRYNRVFGYYIEITHTHRDKIPERYIRKQTLVNAERYITPELKEYEEKVLGAEEKIHRIEYELFLELRAQVMEWTDKIQQAAKTIATLDVLGSLAAVASQNRFVRPTLDDSGDIHIEEGRHPIVEALSQDRFVPNDLHLDADQRFLMITGPNMAGKSTVMRQTALIVILAQIGSYVPAVKAHLGIVDRILTRVGAFDRMSRGESTFMVEMTEAAKILNEATNKSLILIDEIGRGTSTYDGVAIAWAVAEHIHQKIGARTLFATHYHELIDLPESNPGMKNFNIAVKEWGDRIIFLRKLVAGGTSRSYGVEVARLAGLPKEVIEKAQSVLADLEQQHLKTNGSQLPLFGQKSEKVDHPVLGLLAQVDPDQLTPLEALNLLHDLKSKLESV